MKSTYYRSDILIKRSPIHGYGVFAAQDFQPGDLIEECYTLLVPKKSNILIDYVFGNTHADALALGYGSIYNHAQNFNAQHAFDPGERVVAITAVRFIKKGEEIFISYGDQWFSSRQIPLKEPSLQSKLRKLSSALQLLLRFTVVISVLFIVLTFVKA